MQMIRADQTENLAGLPANSLYVVIDLDGQLRATAAAAAGKHFAPIGCGHSLAETMHAHATANFGLVCSFSCHFSSSQRLITK